MIGDQLEHPTPKKVFVSYYGALGAVAEALPVVAAGAVVLAGVGGQAGAVGAGELAVEHGPGVVGGATGAVALLLQVMHYRP